MVRLVRSRRHPLTAARSLQQNLSPNEPKRVTSYRSRAEAIRSRPSATPASPTTFLMYRQQAAPSSSGLRDRNCQESLRSRHKEWDDERDGPFKNGTSHGGGRKGHPRS